MSRHLIIVNPIAAKGGALKQVPRIHERLKELGLEYDLVLTEYPWHAAELTQQAILDGYDVVVSAGGDGTTNEVINGILKSRQAGLGSIKLGVLPIGRGNDFAFGAGVPTNFEESLRTLAQAKTRLIDIGFIQGGNYPEGRFFGNGVGIGFDAVVGFIANQSRLTGFVSYLVAAIKTVFLYFEAPTVEILLDDRTLQVSALMVSIMNGRRMGGGFMMAPKSSLEDGVFDLCIVDSVSKPRIFALIPLFMRGNQENHPAIRFERSRRVHVRAVQGILPAHADGETISTKAEKLTVELLPAQIELIYTPDKKTL